MKALRAGPAAEAGLKSGDIITAVDGRSINGMPLTNSVDLMKGTAGSRMQLRIVRNGSQGTDVTLVRRRVRVYTVNDYKLLPGTENVAYMSLSQFGEKSTEELDQALMELHNKGMKSLVIDLRGNPGGLLNVCVDITNRFLPCGTIVSTKGRLASDNMVETASYERTWSTPLVVLVDGDSASASEIFAAAVQDNRRGIVVGERSYGKGTVQTHFPLSSVSGNLRLTTARFYSPNGKAMSGEGVTPDVRIADADGPANGDRVLDEAITIAQSQRLKDIAQAAKQCRPRTGSVSEKNTAKGSKISDMIAPRTVVR
jgi:carboxyl-terminal processing protease